MEQLAQGDIHLYQIAADPPSDAANIDSDSGSDVTGFDRYQMGLNDSFSYLAWIKPTDLVGGETIIANRFGNEGRHRFEMNADHLGFRSYNGKKVSIPMGK